MSPVFQYLIEHLAVQLIGALLIALVGWCAKSLSEMSRSVQTLNVKLAVVLEKLDTHEHRIAKLETEK